MTKAEDVLRKCLSGKKLNVDKWSKNTKRRCPNCNLISSFIVEEDGTTYCDNCGWADRSQKISLGASYP